MKLNYLSKSVRTIGLINILSAIDTGTCPDLDKRLREDKTALVPRDGNRTSWLGKGYKDLWCNWRDNLFEQKGWIPDSFVQSPRIERCSKILQTFLREDFNSPMGRNQCPGRSHTSIRRRIALSCDYSNHQFSYIKIKFINLIYSYNF